MVTEILRSCGPKNRLFNICPAAFGGGGAMGVLWGLCYSLPCAHSTFELPFLQRFLALHSSQ